MCNLYSLTTNQEAMRRLFKARDALGNQPSLPAIFPDADAPIVVAEEGERVLTRARWGWSKAKFGWVTNARHLDRWPWRDALEDRAKRCLVPATAFSEYHPTQKTQKGHKAAAWFKLAGEEARPPFAFAGFVRPWFWDKDGLRKKADQALVDAGETVSAMAFLTCAPNALVAPIHAKAMPVILEPQSYDVWLHGDPREAADLQKPYAADAMEIAFIGEKADAGELNSTDHV